MQTIGHQMNRYQVVINPDKRGLNDPRPFHVKDMKGGWICSSHKSYDLAQKRATKLNSEE